MKDLYSKPLRVYLLLGALALWGILCGTQLPVSLFPSSSQTIVSVSVGYGSLSAQQFYDSLGQGLESNLQKLKANDVAAEQIRADYGDSSVNYRLQFGWGADYDEARKVVESMAMATVSTQELAIRRSLNVSSWKQNQGFFAVSFYSPLRSLDEIYDTLSPLMVPLAAKVPDASSVGLYNPSSKEITLKISPEKLALHHLTTLQIENAVREAVTSLNGGSVSAGEKEFQLTIPKVAGGIESLNYVRVSPLSQAPVLLKDVAQISVAISKGGQNKFKTSGVDSLILFADPKEGGNIKRMADDLMAELEKIRPQWPADVEYRVLVNPSDFINQSILSVIKEVGLAAALAVLVLFLFIGSFKNVATAAIEIPLSLVMAFILMKLTGMNLNMISLGGLALSAGMNVDASVVVLENIFRHFEGKHSLTFGQRVDVVVGAVNEVKTPIIASTIASLVVFAPLVFTQGLTNALLGDLAKAVVFSHGLSAIVALILVPTIRLHLMRSGDIAHATSPIEGVLVRIESFYRSSLTSFLKSRRAQMVFVLLVVISLPALILLVVPKLKKEVIGRPETDWLIVGIYSPVFNSPKQIESEITALEASLFEHYGSKILYTFTQIYGSQNGHVMMRLNSRKDMEDLFAKAENQYKNTATLFYWVEKWNPSELRIPNPPDLKLEVLGGTAERRFEVAEDLRAAFSDQGIYDKVETTPSIRRGQFVSIEPHPAFVTKADVISRYDLSHYLRSAAEGTMIESLTEGVKSLPIYMRFPEERTKSLEQLQALPVGFEGRLVPLGALANFQLKPRPPQLYRENLTSMVQLTARMNTANQSSEKDHHARALQAVEAAREKIRARTDIPAAEQPTLNVAVANQELLDALDQLKWAVLISMALVFLTMVLQLGDVVQAGLVMIAIPLGLIGVIASLFVFGSSLSLNSGLGTILLNGIAVANSIILVDFIRTLFESGKSALEATIEASTTRLRPILMTSMTTVLGMLPIALGFGEGGKILQPLGIAVCGGLWASALMTLYAVPALQYLYLKRKDITPGLNVDFVETSPEAHP